MTPKRPTFVSAGRRPATERLRLAGRPPSGLVSLIAFAALAGLIAPAASADDHEDDERNRYYFEFQSGVSHVPNQTIDGKRLGPGVAVVDLREPGNRGIELQTIQGSVQPDEVGFNVGGAIGRQFTDNLRGEFAISYREGNIDQAGLVTGGQQADGKTSLLAVMLNVYADLPLGPITPWIGVGVGGGEYKIDVFQKERGVLDIDDADAVLVYNAMAGFSIPINEVVSFNFGYRYIALAGEGPTTGAEIETPAIPGIPPVMGIDGMGDPIVLVPEIPEIPAQPGTPSQLNNEFDAHEAMVGLRFKF